MAFKKVIFSGSSAHLNKLAANVTLPAGDGDLSATKLYGALSQGHTGTGDINKILINTGANGVLGEWKHVQQSDIDSTEATINFASTSLLGGSWNGTVSGVNLRLKTGSIASDGLVAGLTAGEISASAKSGGSIIVNSNGVSLDQSIADTTKGLEFSSNKLGFKLGNNLEFNGSGQIQRKSGVTVGFEETLSEGNGIETFSYNGQQSRQINIDLSEIIGSGRGLKVINDKVSLDTGSFTVDSSSIMWSNTDTIAQSKISRNDGDSTITIDTNTNIPNALVVEGDFTVEGSTNRVEVRDQFVLVNADGGDADFGVQGNQLTSPNFRNWIYDTSEGRFAFATGTTDGGTQTIKGHGVVVKEVAPSLADASIQKQGNIVIDSNEVYIYAS